MGPGRDGPSEVGIMNRWVNRRRFLARTVAAGLGSIGWAGTAAPRRRSPNERLNLGVIGVANRGAANLEGVQSENVVALCDVDDLYLRAAAARFPRARTYHDFRRLLDQPDLDAVVVSTPDHVHAFASIWAMEAGLHVYCEKPLTHSVHEARLAARTALRRGVSTQMGTQIHAGDNYRRVVEHVRSGTIGQIAECHVWIDKTWSGGDRPTETPPVPPHLNWDLWLGPAPERPYHPTYLPGEWRRWWEFGNGTIGDMACHYLDLPFWALQLRHPITITAHGPDPHPETTPLGLTVEYEFPARRDGDTILPPVRLTWRDSGLKPPELDALGVPQWPNGVLFVGSNGLLLADYDRHRLFPENDFEAVEPPALWIPASTGHYVEWIEACKTGAPTTCNFDYAGALTETVLLGNVAFRARQPIRWNAARLKAENCPEAEALIRPPYRRGWRLA